MFSHKHVKTRCNAYVHSSLRSYECEAERDKGGGGWGSGTATRSCKENQRVPDTDEDPGRLHKCSPLHSKHSSTLKDRECACSGDRGLGGTGEHLKNCWNWWVSAADRKINWYTLLSRCRARTKLSSMLVTKLCDGPSWTFWPASNPSP